MHVRTSRTTPVSREPRGIRSRWVCGSLFALCFALVGCRASWAESAGAKFAEDASCPQHRVVVQTRFYQPPSVSPPPAIESDPERLSMWRAKEETLERPRPYFVAQGCGEEQTYYCERTYSARGRPDHVCAAVRGSRGSGE
jgi:hypothetical protein